MKNIKRKIFLFLNYLFAISLILSYISVHVSPVNISLLVVFSLAYPFLLLINFIFLIYLIYKGQKFYLISLISIIIGFNHIGNFFSFGVKKKHDVKSGIKVLSYNVRMFDLYNWSEKKGTGQNILNSIKQKKADIICLQEFYSNPDKINYQDSIISVQKTKGYLISQKKKDNYSGNAIFSKFPIINEGMVDIGGISNQKCLFADLLIEKDTIRVYSIHLASIHLNRDDYNFFISSKNINGIKKIAKKIINASKKRAKESDIISAHIKKSPYKMIICGDFNDIPVSYSYRKIRGNLKDAFQKSGSGIGRTYVIDFLFFRIDYILHSPELKSYNFEIGNNKLSDHYSVYCEIKI